MQNSVNVLMIEDDDEDFLIARTLLARSGGVRFALDRRANLREGLAAIRIDTEAVLLDLSLPDSQGWATFLSVREHAPHVPIILLTGLDDEMLGMKAVHGGAQDYLVKGQFDGRLLSRAILYAIERKTAEERLEHLADELGVANSVMAADLAMAREVQQSLMPTEFPPHTDGSRAIALRMGLLYSPCKSLGGDFYTVLPVSATEVAVFLCDVVGHGVRSALVTAVLRGLVEEAKSAAHDPGRFLTLINRAFMQVLSLHDRLLFVTSVCVFVDTRRGLLRGANAGHPPPLRVDASGKSEWLPFHGEEPAPALGLDKGFTYRTVECAMGIGDRLLLYTDGIYEACSPGGEEYGRERLMAAFKGAGSVSMEETPVRVLQDARRFAGREDFEDDVCMVGIERTVESSDGENSQ